MGKLGVKGKGSNITFVSLELKFGRDLRNVKILSIDVIRPLFIWSLLYLFLEIFVLLL